MTEQEYYQKKLIDSLEIIRHDMEHITNGISHVDKYLVFSVIDKHLDREKAIYDFLSSETKAK